MSKTNEQGQNCYGEQLVPITIRFTKDVYTAIEELAEQYDVSVAQVVRLAVDGNLSKYLGQLQYIDRSQARTINLNICVLGDRIREVGNQLRRIGINYNQEVKLKQIESQNLTDLERQQAVDEIKKDTTSLDVNTIKNLMKSFEKTANELGEKLWHIQG